MPPRRSPLRAISSPSSPSGNKPLRKARRNKYL